MLECIVAKKERLIGWVISSYVLPIIGLKSIEDVLKMVFQIDISLIFKFDKNEIVCLKAIIDTLYVETDN